MSSSLANGFLKKYHGVAGGVLFRGKAAANLAEKFPALKSMNNALWAAPAWKWGQSMITHASGRYVQCEAWHTSQRVLLSCLFRFSLGHYDGICLSGLAIVPLYGVLSGSPVEKVDLNNALALTGTGAIWAYYSMLVRPKSYGLFSVSVALVCANGWNAYRRHQYDLNQTHSTPIPTPTKQLLPAATFAEKK